MLTLLPKGTVVRFEYRKSGTEHWEPRIAILWGVRDLRAEPLSEMATEERPDLERGVQLFRAYDLARQDYRHFYLARMRSVLVADLTPVLIVARGMQRRADNS